MHQTIEHYFNNLSSQGAIAGIYEYVNQLENVIRSDPHYSGQDIEDFINACAKKAQAYAENESEPEEG